MSDVYEIAAFWAEQPVGVNRATIRSDAAALARELLRVALIVKAAEAQEMADHDLSKHAQWIDACEATCKAVRAALAAKATTETGT